MKRKESNNTWVAIHFNISVSGVVLLLSAPLRSSCWFITPLKSPIHTMLNLVCCTVLYSYFSHSPVAVISCLFSLFSEGM
ncbi:hypothetical protein B0O80DRAFT_456357 [Mortierella sp. GBAus27b]|nr:hypothetical protein B0O80DRAFT_456357 [Mortierella sp. GBAus27b]